MKKLLLFFSLTIGLFFWACYEDRPTTPKEESFAIENAQEIVETFNAGKLPLNKGDYLRAGVSISVVGKDKIGIIVDDDRFEKGLYYMLQVRDLNERNVTEVDLPMAEIVFLKKSLVINSLRDNQRFLFKLSDARVPIENVHYTKVYNGYGMVRATGSIYSRASCGCNNYSQSDENCDSGGYGASSCSTGTLSSGSCSVTCSIGYACCEN